MSKYDEALAKYKVEIPPPEVFYSEVYQIYFKEAVPTKVNPEFEVFRRFQEIYVQSLYQTFHKSDNSSIANTRNAVVLGGQAGAGKTSLSIAAKREYLSEFGKHLFLIDDDIYRHLFPNGDDLLKEYPEFYTQISATVSSTITPKMLDYAVSNGLNFIFDGTMKNDRILHTSDTWPGYTINWKIMATSKIESLLSIAERNKELKKAGTSRLINVETHNTMYDGLEKTVDTLEKSGRHGTIQVYIRGTTLGYPVCIYDSSREDNIYPSAVIAVRAGRLRDRNQTLTRGIDSRLAAIVDDPNLSEEERKIVQEIHDYVATLPAQYKSLTSIGSESPTTDQDPGAPATSTESPLSKVGKYASKLANLRKTSSTLDDDDGQTH